MTNPMNRRQLLAQALGSTALFTFGGTSLASALSAGKSKLEESKDEKKTQDPAQRKSLREERVREKNRDALFPVPEEIRETAKRNNIGTYDIAESIGYTDAANFALGGILATLAAKYGALYREEAEKTAALHKANSRNDGLETSLQDIATNLKGFCQKYDIEVPPILVAGIVPAALPSPEQEIEHMISVISTDYNARKFSVDGFVESVAELKTILTPVTEKLVDGDQTLAALDEVAANILRTKGFKKFLSSAAQSAFEANKAAVTEAVGGLVGKLTERVAELEINADDPVLARVQQQVKDALGSKSTRTIIKEQIAAKFAETDLIGKIVDGIIAKTDTDQLVDQNLDNFREQLNGAFSSDAVKKSLNAELKRLFDDRISLENLVRAIKDKAIENVSNDDAKSLLNAVGETYEYDKTEQALADEVQRTFEETDLVGDFLDAVFEQLGKLEIDSELLESLIGKIMKSGQVRQAIVNRAAKGVKGGRLDEAVSSLVQQGANGRDDSSSDT